MRRTDAQSPKTRYWLGTSVTEHWCPTVLERLVARGELVKWEVGWEIAPSTGSEHFHLIVHTAIPQRESWFRNNVSKNIHWESVRKLDNLRRYIRKLGEDGLVQSGGAKWPSLDIAVGSDGRPMTQKEMFDHALNMEDVTSALKFLRHHDPKGYMNNAQRWSTTLRFHFSERACEKKKKVGPMYELKDFIQKRYTPIVMAITVNLNGSSIWIQSEPRYGKTSFLETWYKMRLLRVGQYYECEAFEAHKHDAIVFDDFAWSEIPINVTKTILDDCRKEKEIRVRYINMKIPAGVQVFVLSNKLPKQEWPHANDVDVKAVTERCQVIQLKKRLFE